MKRLTKLVLILLSVVSMTALGQSPIQDRNSAQDTQVRGYWVDPSTGLMWAAKDNGKDLSWKNAMKYCRNLRLAGYSDWRLANLQELEGIYDKNAKAPGLMGPSGKGSPATWYVKGNLFLTGTQWTSSQRMDDRGKPSGYAWRFDFNDGRSFGGDELWFYTDKRALCVRDSGESHIP
jgi:hypothetical protein